MDKLISIHPEVHSGVPVFFGTRVPIKNLFDYMETGESLTVFLEHFPSVKENQAVSILELAKKLLTSSSQIFYENIA